MLETRGLAIALQSTEQLESQLVLSSYGIVLYFVLSSRGERDRARDRRNDVISIAPIFRTA